MFSNTTPIFTITANNWAAASEAAARRQCVPKVRQKSKSSGASPQRSGPGHGLGLDCWGEEYINYQINGSDEESIEMDVELELNDVNYSGRGHSPQNQRHQSHSTGHSPQRAGSNHCGYGYGQLLQVPSSSTLMLPHQYDYDVEGEENFSSRTQRSSSITVPLLSGGHCGRRPERCSSELVIRRCSSTSPKGRLGVGGGDGQYQAMEERRGRSHETSPQRRRDRGYSLTVSQPHPLLGVSNPNYNSNSNSNCARRDSTVSATTSYRRLRRKSSGARRASTAHHSNLTLSSSSSSTSLGIGLGESGLGLNVVSANSSGGGSGLSPGASPGKRRRSHVPPPSIMIQRQRTLSMPAIEPMPVKGEDGPRKKKDGGEIQNKKKKKIPVRGRVFDVVIIGSPNVGKNTLAEYFRKGGGCGGTSGSDQGIGSCSCSSGPSSASEPEEDVAIDSYDDQDLVGGKGILWKPGFGFEIEKGKPVAPFNFSLRIFCDQISAVNHLYKYDAVLLLYSVTDRDSFAFARSALAQLAHAQSAPQSTHAPKKVVILVGNKSDLERSRSVSPLEGRSLATAYDVKFIEISSSLELGIEPLQKGLATQIQLRENLNFNSSLACKRSGSSSSTLTTSSSIRLLASSPKLHLSSLKLAQKLIDRISSLKIGGGKNKTKSCLDLHSL